jgi:hypothetical protein
MLRPRFSFLALLATAVLVMTGCSSSSGTSNASASCQPLSLDGSVFSGTGTATLTGNGTLPDGIADGLELQLLVQTGGVSIGVVPDALFNDRVCGKTFHYVVKGIDAGTHTLTFEVFDTTSASLDPVLEGTSPSSFTIADGQMLTMDTVFQLSAK